MEQENSTSLRELTKEDGLLQAFLGDNEDGLNFRQRRHDEWTENYIYFRNKVITNRVTQRQSVNVPLMKSSILTLLKDIDDAPMLYYKDLGNNEQKEVFYNEFWKDSSKRNKLIIKDIVDKKQGLLFGRTFKKQNIVDGKHYWEVVDPQHIRVSRYMDPANIDTSRFLIHECIYKSISELERNDAIDKSGLAYLKQFYASEKGLIKAESNSQAAQDQRARLEELGVLDVTNPILGEVIVELKEWYRYRWDSEKGREVIYVSIVAEDQYFLSDEKLCDVLGETEDDFWYDHYPFSTWGADVERTDFWSDAPADSVRGGNKIVNSMISSKVENGTLKNFGMKYYDSTKGTEEGGTAFVPQSFIPIAWGWYPVPGDPNKMIKDVEIPDLGDLMQEIEFVMGLTDRATAATAANQGVVEKQDATLGEIKISISNAKDRVRSMAALYTDCWEDFGQKYIKLMEGARNLLEPRKIVKKGREGKRYYTRVITPDEFYSHMGWVVEVRDISQTSGQDLEEIQKLNAARSIMPANKPLNEIYKKKVAEFAGLNASEVKEVMEYEKNLANMPINSAGIPGAGPTTPQLPAGQFAQQPIAA